MTRNRFMVPVTVFALVIVTALGSPILGASAGSQSLTFTPPQTLLSQLDVLEQIDKVSDLPADLRIGRFIYRDGLLTGGEGGPWLAEPHAPFNGGDAQDPNLPNKRLIFAACSAKVCILHYASGGLAGPNYLLLTLALQSNGLWKAIWAAQAIPGGGPIPDLKHLKTLLRTPHVTTYFDFSP